VNCLVCGKNAMTPLYGATLMECSECSFITTNMEIDVNVLRSLYKDFFHTQFVFDYKGTRRSRQIDFTRKISKILRYVDESSIADVLEIGCAYGFFGEVLTRRLEGRPRYTGIDISPEPIEYGSKELGLDVLCGDYLAYDFGRRFSDIFMWDTIEHLLRPQDFVAKIASDLIPGGRLYIGTPNIKSLLARIRGRKWRNIIPPAHLHYFSPMSIRRLLENYGLHTLYIGHPPVYRSLKLVWYHLVAKKTNARLAFAILNLIPEGLAFPLNTYDNMLVMAVKPA